MLYLPECPKNYRLAVEVSSEDVHEFLDALYKMGYHWFNSEEPSDIEYIVNRKNLISLEDNKRLFYGAGTWYKARHTPRESEYLENTIEWGYIIVSYKDLLKDDVLFDDIEQMLHIAAGKEV